MEESIMDDITLMVNQLSPSCEFEVSSEIPLEVSEESCPVTQTVNKSAQEKLTKPVATTVVKQMKPSSTAWEVEWGEKVEQFLTNPKVPEFEKKAFFDTIDKLAYGIPLDNPKKCKKLRSGIDLFESRCSHDSRIIFEIAIQFSPRLSTDKHIFSDVIRVWDIVRHHDRLNRAINHVVQCIKKSHSQLLNKKAVIPLKTTNRPEENNIEGVRLPQYYGKCEGISDTLLVYAPAGSTENNYNVAKFYSAESLSMQSFDIRRDFPLKGWPREHDIINMPHGKGSILLLGRSGTGKTICCLYRLWNQFRTYWGNEVSAQNGVKQLQDADSGTQHPERKLHQVFITKNYVLCAQMKKNFINLVAGSEVAEYLKNIECDEIPTSLSEIEDHAYPLFLTARQFFVLLDNSLEGSPFFSRDENGCLALKIISSDYDHENPDTLLDLEMSDSEDEDDYSSDHEECLKSQPVAKKKEVTEITASYFAENFWHKKVTPRSKTKIDPVLAWMEIKSFIKGSRDAMEKKEGYLNLEDYESLFSGMAPTYKDKRPEVYKIFQIYQHFVKDQKNIFDECDLCHSIYTRLNSMTDLPWSIDSIYIDEVQDFTQAELAILLRICRNPNDLFLTGDTAQSIMKDVSFRFEDLKGLFYEAKKSSKSVKVLVPELTKLTLNLRSHSGILQLAASVIELMKYFFPCSFDYLEEDQGMFSGPIPTVLRTSDDSDLAQVLSVNKCEINFGANQVVIVQSEEARENIPEVLKDGIVLTIFEAKGLEFNDVLLYNFFKDSKAGKYWHEVKSHMENILCNSGKKSMVYDKVQHKILNSELKYLYTAITRAKCNLWIYDDSKDFLPIFEYWRKKKLVSEICIGETNKEFLSKKSSLDDWISQGDYYKQRRYWWQAIKCYQSATKYYPEAKCSHLEQEAKAYYALTQGNYLEAAQAFLKYSQLQHDHNILEKAARCLMKMKNCSHLALQLFLHLDQNQRALHGYRKARDEKGLATVYEKMGNYNAVIQVLCVYNNITDALKYAARYEESSIQLYECYSTHYMACDYAEKLTKSLVTKSQVSVDQFEKVLKFLTPSEKVFYYKEAHMYKRACEVLKAEKKFCNVFRIYKAQGWYEDGIHLARELGKSRELAIFVIFKATVELAETPCKLHESTLAMVQEIQDETSAVASLVCGRVMQNSTIIKEAQDFYHIREHYNFFGQIEAFSAALEGAEYNSTKQVWENIVLYQKDLISMMFTICKEIRHVVNALNSTNKSSTVHWQLANQLECFYGLEKKYEMYYIPCSSYPWTNQLLEEEMEGRKDEDGMLKVDTEFIYKKMHSRLESLIKAWIIDDKYQIVEHFLKQFVMYRNLHHEMIAGGYLQQAYSEADLENKKNYLDLLCNAFELACYGNDRVGTKNTLFGAYIASISPQATHYLPFTSQIPSDAMIIPLTKLVSDILKTSDQTFDFNKWLMAWHINCVTREGFNKMKEELSMRSHHHHERLCAVQKFDHHHTVYILDRNKNYKHIILFWLRTCELMCDNKILASSTVFVNTILRHIASTQFIHDSISITNLLSLVTVHTTAILTMHAACSAKFHSLGNAYLPKSYNNVVCTFQNMVKPYKLDFLQSCVHYITTRQKLSKVQYKLKKMLMVIFDVMTGSCNKEYNPLRDAVTKKECLRNGEAHHCLVFVFTLFCNIALLVQNPKKLQNFRLQIYKSIQHCQEPNIMKVYCQFLNSDTLLECFNCLKDLLKHHEDSLLHIQVSHLLQIDLRQPSFLSDQVIIRVKNLFPILPFPLAYNRADSSDADALQLADKVCHHALQNLPLMESVESNSTEVGEVSIYPFHFEDSTEQNYVIICHVCACQLHEESTFILTERNALEFYHHHCKINEDHEKNVELKKIFDSNNEVLYHDKQRLCEMLQSCTSLLKFQQQQEVQEVMIAIQIETENIEDSISNIRCRGEWEKGIDQLYNYQKMIDSLNLRASSVIEQTMKRKLVIEEKKKENLLTSEDYREEHPEEDEDIDIPNRVFYTRQRSKEISRKRKKYKRTISKK